MTRAQILGLRSIAAGCALTALSLGVAPAQENPSDRDEVIHVLNRITFGPRPGDVDAVQKMGLHTYIEQQLHPESIDDSAVESNWPDSISCKCRPSNWPSCLRKSERII